jgi:hypothetical protein
MKDIKLLPFQFDASKLIEACNFVFSEYEDLFEEYSDYLKEQTQDEYLGSLNMVFLMGVKGVNTQAKITNTKFHIEDGVFVKSFDNTIGTYFENVAKELSTMYDIGRITIYKLGPNALLPTHIDAYEKVLIPITTNPNCITSVFKEDETIDLNLPANGTANLFNAAAVSHRVTNNGNDISYRMTFDIINYKPGAITLDHE